MSGLENLNETQKTLILSALSTVNTVGGGSAINGLLMELSEKWELEPQYQQVHSMHKRVLANLKEEAAGHFGLDSSEVKVCHIDRVVI